MAISVTRLNELLKEFEPVKVKIDDIDRKYGLDYCEPQMDMPESLDLPRLEYEPKSDEQLNRLADEQTYASYLANVNRLNVSNASANLRLDKRLSELEEKTRVKIATLHKKLNDELEDVNVKITNAGMLFSTVAERVKIKLRRACDADVEEANTRLDNDREAVETERASLNADHANALEDAENLRQAQIRQAYVKLAEDEQAQREKVEKYNNLLSEKETKYKMSYAKALEAARQAEYDRTYKAKKLYQQMGATGYEESKLWEKYNVFVSHFATFTKREEALALIQCDAYVQGHLKQYYSTLVDWVNRNVPA